MINKNSSHIHKGLIFSSFFIITTFIFNSCSNDVTKSPLTPLVSSKTINYSNFDPTTLSEAQISAAAELDVYFEHASVGQDIVGDSNSDTKEGFDSNTNTPQDCGLHLLQDSQSRYFANRASWSYSNTPTWFDGKNGFGDNHRGNPQNKNDKITGFQSSITATLAAKLDVAMFKFCWIDTPTDGQALFDSVKSVMESLETTYPSVTFVWWTMPIAADEAPVGRQNYNDLVRAYCNANNKWLMDIASIQSHDDSGTPCLDTDGRERVVPAYALSMGGDNHLTTAGKIKMAKAWWKLLARIAGAP